ncbi:CARDB domain-containing protein [Hyalangium versicolor]|uniref:CARDB domain-containing protein n=1 Tax=Hyalangium versicolor TaxID=2861190 RepID=UPI001CCD2E60|nr:CARDB domain-containing protein [Hyalangium versicolor]
MQAAHRQGWWVSLLMASAVMAGCSRGNSGPAELFLDSVVGAIATSGKPDLWVSSVSGPASATSGSGYFVTVTACNQGAGSIDSEVKLYLSQDPSITATDTLVGSAPTGMLRSKQCTPLHVRTRGPVSVSNGLWYLGAIIDPADTVSEVSETNNARAGTRMAIGSGAELQVSEVRAPESLSPSASFEATVQVCNPGTVSASAEVDVYLSADTTLTDEDLWMGRTATGSLGEGQCASVVVSSSVQMPRGTWHVAAWVDRANAVPELEEHNNTRVGSRLVVDDGPDFTVSVVTGPASLPNVATEPITLTATVCNMGTESAAARVEGYLSADSTLTASDILVGSAPVETLAPGQCAPVEIHGSASLGSGLWYVAAWVDRANAVPELMEDNNTRFGLRTPAGHAPDLSVASVSGPDSVGASQPVRATATVCNPGTSRSAATSVAFFLSQDATITTADVLLGFAPVPELQISECVSVEATGPARVQEGSWYVGAFVDGDNALAELSESNNLRTGNLIGVGESADLSVASVTGPAYVQDTQPLTAQVTVCNPGTRASGESAHVGLFLSADATITASDTLLGDASLPALQAGQCTTVSLSSAARLPSGTWVLGAIADLYGAESELLKDNNSRAGGSLAVGTTLAALNAPAGFPSSDSFTAELSPRR